MLPVLHYQSYIKSATIIIELYKGEEPFANFLKKYFAANKKFGSKDRKHISTLCYNFYRMGKALPDIIVSEKIILATFLCGNYEKEFVLLLKDDWINLNNKSIAEKLQGLQINPLDIFPFKKEFSKEISQTALCLSFFTQPKLFLRFRPNYLRYKMIEKLTAAKVDYAFETLDCLAFANSTKVDDILDVGAEVIVQDYNSQQTLNYIKENIDEFKFPNSDVWDCCAASGGKSILFYDIVKSKSKITVSDIRLSILQNLHQRFRNAGIDKYDYFVCDLQKNTSPFPDIKYTTIICDAPCSGSGTWGRTPEQLYFFDTEKINYYSTLQKQIITNTMPQLKPGGYFIYITCSVFAEENEMQVAFIKKEFSLQLMHMELLKGYDKLADNMFVAVFKKANL
ncbi:MAG: Fmu (Sun) domain-containing protein [Chitinophagaceae bacterium]|nr:Fmu (Sun) domain-containing protein [Chitinophagaceae bacterium]